jgi:glycosyltransferase involved in cell wall biosynthesis
MRVLFLTEGRDVPASRFRAEQLFPELDRLGVDCTLLGGYGPLYQRVHGTLAGPPYKLVTRLKRAVAGFAGVRYDAVFLQRTAIPHTALPERALAAMHPRLVFDFDDALWLGAGGRPSSLRKRAFEEAIACSRWVVAGNRFLAERANAPHKTTVLPTVIDTDRYRPDVDAHRDGLVVGWMGTAPNLPFLSTVLPGVLRAVESVPGARVRIVSNGALPELADHPQVEQVRWSRENEIPMLQSFDVGLMPLPDDELTRGKCGFKMIQYMAVGAAVVASAVGANVELFEGSDAGTLVAPGASFGDAVHALLVDADRRREAGRRGREHAVANLSVPRVAAQYAEIFRRVATL